MSVLARRAFLLGAGASTLVVKAALADTPFTTFAFPGTNRPTSRTQPDRIGEIYNWKDFGAIGDGGPHPLSDRYATLGAAQAVYSFVTSLTQQIDWAAIQAAVNAMNAGGGGLCYGPPGNYFLGTNVKDQIDLTGNALVRGAFIGAGTSSTTIFSTNNTDYTVNLPYQVNGVGYIADMSIYNFSTTIGTGALRNVQGNGQGVVKNLVLGGMCSLDMGWDIFNTTVIGITATGQGILVSPYGSVGMMCSGASVYGWREASSHEIGLTLTGQQSMVINAVSYEITPAGIAIGQQINQALGCTITGPDGSKVLTVPSNSVLSPPKAATTNPIQSGDFIVMNGVDPRLNPAIRINAQLTDTSQDQTGNQQGTYSLTGADGVTISTPTTITMRRRWLAGNYVINGVQTEGCVWGIFVLQSGNGVMNGVGLGGVINQGCTNQYSGFANGPYASSPYCGIFISNASSLKIATGGPGVRTAKAAFMFHGLFTSVAQFRAEQIIANPGQDATSDANAFIDDGSGATLATNAGTASSSAVLHFPTGTIPGSVVAGVPVYDNTDITRIPQNTRVLSVNNGAGTVTLSKNTNGVLSGDTIKFCVPSGTAGRILTVQDVTGNIGRTPDVPPAGFDDAGAPIPKGGAAVQGTGIPTGANTPMIRDMIGGWTGGGFAQYTLIKADGTPVSTMNIGPEVLTFRNGRAWGIDNLTGLSGINGGYKSGIKLVDCNNGTDTLDMNFADLPGQPGVADTSPGSGVEYTIVNSNTATWGANAAGGGSNNVLLRYNGTNWTVVGK